MPKPIEVWSLVVESADVEMDMQFDTMLATFVFATENEVFTQLRNLFPGAGDVADDVLLEYVLSRTVAYIERHEVAFG